MYNNLQCRKLFDCPGFLPHFAAYQCWLPTYWATYQLESDKPVKIVHKLINEVSHQRLLWVNDSGARFRPYNAEFIMEGHHVFSALDLQIMVHHASSVSNYWSRQTRSSTRSAAFIDDSMIIALIWWSDVMLTPSSSSTSQMNSQQISLIKSTEVVSAFLLTTSICYVWNVDQCFMSWSQTVT